MFQSVLTTVPRGQLGNHLHSYALLSSLQVWDSMYTCTLYTKLVLSPPPPGPSALPLVLRLLGDLELPDNILQWPAPPITECGQPVPVQVTQWSLLPTLEVEHLELSERSGLCRGIT